MAKQTFTTGQVLTAAQMTSLQQTAMGGGAATAKTTSYVLVAADAGTVVAMNAAGSTTITVNTGLFSAGDSVFIQNWGAGTTTVTAGTATVTTHGSLALGQYEGGQLYFTSSSAAIFFDISQSAGMVNPMTTTGDTIYSSSGSTPARLGIGSTGNVLTVAGGVPTWAAPAGGGKVLQVVYGSSKVNTSISSSTLTDTGLSASITPTATTSKVLILITQHYKTYNSTGGIYWNGSLDLLRNSTSILTNDNDTIQYIAGAVTTSGLNNNFTYSMNYLDSPSTTSSTTYKTQAAKTTGTSVTCNGAGYSTITLLEIGA